MSKQIVVIKANGETYNLEKSPSLKQMQEIVGGHVEHVRVLDRIEKNGRLVHTSMYVNETGMLDGLPRNQTATEIYQRNVRAQFPGAENPFQAASKAFEEQMKGFTFIRPETP